MLVVGQPLIAANHARQQAALRTKLAARFGGDSRVKYVDLSRTIDLSDRTLAYDGMHLTPPANAVIAAALTPLVRAMAETEPRDPVAAR